MVDPLNHPGFLGKIRPKRFDDSGKAVGVAAQIPVHPFPYYADAVTEVAFITPTLSPSSSNSTASLRSGESSDSAPDIAAASVPTLTAHQGAAADHPPAAPPPHFALKEPQGSGVSESHVHAEHSTRGHKLSSAAAVAVGAAAMKADSFNADTPRRRLPLPQDCAALVVWLEKFEDHLSFPLEALSGILHGASFTGFAGGSHKPSQRSLPTIFIHQLSSGLYQITTRSSGR